MNKKNKELLKIRENQFKLKELLEAIGKITIKRKVGKDNLIFGSVNEKDILTAIESKTGEKIDKKNIIMPLIESIGNYKIIIKLGNQIDVNIEMQIIPE